MTRGRPATLLIGVGLFSSRPITVKHSPQDLTRLNNVLVLQEIFQRFSLVRDLSSSRPITSKHSPQAAKHLNNVHVV